MYVRDNSINLIDPTGTQTTGELLGAAGTGCAKGIVETAAIAAVVDLASGGAAVPLSLGGLGVSCITGAAGGIIDITLGDSVGEFFGTSGILIEGFTDIVEAAG